MGYHSAIQRNKLLRCATTWLKLKLFLLSERRQIKTYMLGCAWVAQSVEHPTLDFRSGHDSKVVGSCPTSGSVLTAWSLLETLSLYLSLSLFLFFSHSPFLCLHSLSFSKKKYTLFNSFYRIKRNLKKHKNVGSRSVVASEWAKGERWILQRGARKLVVVMDIFIITIVVFFHEWIHISKLIKLHSLICTMYQSSVIS